MHKIELYGKISSDLLIEQLNTCHLYVHPSYIENSPNSVCEAMLLGMPLLASSVGGTKTIVEHGKTGFLFNPYDKYDLAGWIIHLIQHYDQALKVGKNARQIALRRHSPESIISDLQRIYSTIINDN